MELKITNFDVTTKEVKLSQTAELPIDIDIQIGEYETDIKKILKCTISSFVSSKQISGSNLFIEGNSVVNLIYCDKDGIIYSAEKQIPFKKTCESSAPLEGGNIKINTSSYVNSCMLMTEKRVAVKGTVKLEISVTSNEKKSIISDLDDECFEQLCTSAKAAIPIGESEKSFIIDEELILDENMPPIAKILNTNYNACISETKIINNKIVLKGQLKINVFYLTSGNGCACYKTSIPFNQIIELAGLTEDCKCDTDLELCNVSLTTRTSPNGECKTLLLVAKLMATAEAICENDIPIIHDLYSKNYVTKITKQDIMFSKIVHQSKESFICKKTLSFSGDNVCEVINLWCESEKCIPHFGEENIIISGAITVGVIFKNSDNELCYSEKVIDYDYPLQTNCLNAGQRCRTSAQISDSSYSITPDGNIDVNMTLGLSAIIYDTVTMSVITDVIADDKECIKNSTSLVAYFAEPGENVWEISKSFLADRNSLMEINDIKEEVISTPKMLLIPRF